MAHGLGFYVVVSRVHDEFLLGFDGSWSRFVYVVGATIVDKIFTITPAHNYVPRRENMQNSDGNGGRAYVGKAQDVMATVLAKGSALGQDAVNKAKTFDELNQLRADASAKVSLQNKPNQEYTSQRVFLLWHNWEN
ncbi:hypothetical protein Bca101_044900 [Brassica carinata]